MGPFRQRGRRAARDGGGGFGLPALEDPTHLMAYEFARARRYERPISMMALPWAGLPEDAVLLRFSDILAIDRRREMAYVMMPETDAPGAVGAVRRIRDAVPGVHIGAATFPEDALTLQDLMDVATDRISSTPTKAEAA